jgi:hypothetical protein
MRKDTKEVSITGRRFSFLVLSIAAWVSAFGGSCANRPPGKTEARPEGSTGFDAGQSPSVGAAVPLNQPVPLWEDGKVTKQIEAATAAANGYVIIDLGEQWTPYILSEREHAEDAPVPNPYRATYLAFARGQFPSGPDFARVRRDKYLELYGIMPTLSLLRTRFEDTKQRDCASKVDLSPLEQYRGIIAYSDNVKARRDASRFLYLEKKLAGILEKQQVEDINQIDRKRLSGADQGILKQYEKLGPAAKAVRAAQARLTCEGYYEGKRRLVEGALDWSTNEALAEFERRHRIFGWGFLWKETLNALQTPPMELERAAVLRVLTERAMHAAGFLEDGSAGGTEAKPRTYTGADGKDHPIRSLEAEMRENIVHAFGLATPESTLAFIQSLGELPAQRLVAIKRPDPPEYYSDNMDLSVVIDRGDVWYEFPYDEQGKERAQPVRRRPHLVVSVDYRGQKVPLVNYNTTIGGWRSETIDGTVMWKYKNSPVGPRIWRQIVAAPVWLPPNGTPVKSLLKPVPDKTGKDAFKVNYDEIGPGYASAYGLVAAYHLRYQQKEDGSIELGGDEAIRTHGSVDYMSILERHSHGCHRLYNHLAVRLMSFVLAHRPHHRVGQQKLVFRLPLKQPSPVEGEEDYEYTVEVDKGGYVYELERPVPVEVQKGRINGVRKTPIETPIPKYDDKVGAYVNPDGTAVKVDRSGNMTPTEPPTPASDGGAPLDPSAAAAPPTAEGPP